MHSRQKNYINVNILNILNNDYNIVSDVKKYDYNVKIGSKGTRKYEINIIIFI